MTRRTPLPPREDGDGEEPNNGDGGNEPGMPRPEGSERITLSNFSKGNSGALPVALIPWSLVLARRRVAERAQAQERFANWALAIVLTAMFMVNLSVTAVTVAVTEIAREFESSESAVVWAVTGPILVSAVFGPTFGKLGDQRGHRTMFLGGLLVNAVFTVLIAASWGAGSFVVFRLLAAVGGAAIGPAALAFINRLFGPRDRASALGWWSFVGAGSPVIGVLVGAQIIEAFSWRWIFVGQAPLVLAAGLLAAFVLPETTKQEVTGFDLPGATTLGLGVGGLLLGVTFAAENLTAPRVWIAFAVAGLSLAAFVRVERSSPHPLLPPHYWTMPGFIVPTMTLTLMFAAYMGSFVLTPLMLQRAAYGATAAATSWVIIARPLCFSLTGPVSGSLSERFGSRSFGVFGGTSIAVSMVILSQHRPEWSLLVVAGALGLAGIGMGAAAPVMTAAVANAVADEDLGVAGAAQQMLQQVGLVVGIQVLQAVQTAVEDAPLDGEPPVADTVASFQSAFAVGAVLAVAGALMAFRLPRHEATMSPNEDAISP